MNDNKRLHNCLIWYRYDVFVERHSCHDAGLQSDEIVIVLVRNPALLIYREMNGSG